jgi:hypothetical protein
VYAVNKIDVSSTTAPEQAPARAHEPQETKVRSSDSVRSTRRIAPLVIGALLVLASLTLLAAGGTGMWAYLFKREGGYVTTGAHKFSTAGSALATKPTQLGSAGAGWLYSPPLLGRVRIRVTSQSAGPPLFVGIARAGDVDRYLAGVDRTVINDFWDEDVKPVGGGRVAPAPATQRFWVASSNGARTSNLVWKPTDGRWTVVVMRADGRPGLDVSADLGARPPALPWIAVGLLVAGGVLMVGGVLLMIGAIRRRTG